MQIPDHATCTCKGDIFAIYQWEQEMFDGSKTTFEAIKRPDTVQVIPILHGKPVLLKERQPGMDEFYGMVGGRVDDGEEPFDAAARELLEETGLHSDHWELFKKADFSGKIQWTTHYYIARDCKKVAEQQLDAGEEIDLLECTLHKFFNIVHTEKFRNKDFLFHVLQMEHNHELEKFKRRLK